MVDNIQYENMQQTLTVSDNDIVQGVSIIIPTLNEEDNIDLLLKRIFQVKLQKGLKCEVVIVDSDSTDNTRSKVFEWTQAYPVNLVCRELNGGLARAVMHGSREAKFETIVVMDADLSHPPEKIPELLQPLLDGSCDVVIGSRYVDGGATPDWPLSRKAASKLATMPAQLFTDVRDPMAGFFATTRSRLNDLRSDVPGFKIGFELLSVGGDALRVHEIPIVFHERFNGLSKMNRNVIFDYFKQVAQLVGIKTETFTFPRLTMLGVLGVLIDFLFFIVARRAGYEPVFAHLAGIILSGTLLSFAMFQFWRGTNRKRRLSSRMLWGICIALVSSISLQGGVYKLFIQYGGFDDILSFLPAAFLGNFWFVGITFIFVFSDFYCLSQGIKLRLAATGCIIFAGLIRLLYLPLPELIEQEAYYWNLSRHLDICYIDYPPMVAVLIWIGNSLVGISELGVRAMAPVCWVVTACFSYFLTSRVFGRTAALGAVLLLSSLPFYFGTAFIMSPDAPLLACWSTLLFLFYRTLVEGKSGWGWVGLIFGLGMISEYTIFLFILPVVCFMMADKRARRLFLTPGPYYAAIVALLIFSPVIFWNYQNNWSSVFYLREQWFPARAAFNVDSLGGFVLLMLTPVGVLAVIFFLFRGNQFFMKGPESAFSTNGRSVNRSYLFLLLAMILPLAVSFGFSFARDVKLNWTAPFWLSVLPFLGCTVMSVWGGYDSAFLRMIHWLWKLTVFLLLSIYIVFLHHVSLGTPGLEYPAKPFLLGWEELAGQVDAMVDEAEEQTGERPVVVGMNPYQISSGLAFYRTKNVVNHSESEKHRGVVETIGWHVFGWDSRMYNKWYEPEDVAGKDIIVVASGKVRAEYPYFQKHVKTMDPIKEVSVHKGEEEIRKFYVRQVYDYRPIVK